MNEHVIEALRKARYSVLTDDDDLEELYRLRYACYRAEGAVPARADKRMTDAFDETANCLHVAVRMEGRIQAAVRLHLLSKLCWQSPTVEVFPELLDQLKAGKTILDPTRFVISASARRQRIPLNFLTLRIPFLASIFYDIDLALAPVRAEHTAFYRRYLAYEPALEPRTYPGLTKPIQLLTANFQQQRERVLDRTPVFGPLEDFPDASIDFPSLSDVYAPSKSGSSEAA
ncbi:MULTISPECIES: N-acyl amino acid synthase FeeM domain-containing protein [unclassified Roseovarius]|uniref:N-acyl amino acid synthase FeeM domain-containing protein n=1 Tax=unclassified Roseovarius TaxID=2614913 RepID=UPI00273DDA86|nr:GNAT family N-acetyltransferase [Roseovarius sp. MMSF_3350]